MWGIMVWVVSQHKNTRITFNKEKYILHIKRNSVERPNTLNLIVFTSFSFRYFVYVQIDLLVQNSTYTLFLIHISVSILNVHGLGETNSLRIRYSVLPFYITCVNRYICRPVNKFLALLLGNFLPLREYNSVWKHLFFILWLILWIDRIQFFLLTWLTAALFSCFLYAR